MDREENLPPLWLSLVPVAFLVALLVTNVLVFGDSATGGPNQLALFLAAAFAGGVGHFVLRIPYRDLEVRAIKSINLAMQANIILLVVGTLIGIWIMAGVVPTLIYYGVKLINPAVFLMVACAACAIVSITIGSSWTTMGTVGVALIGIGETLGLPLGMVAGAIVSGAYFGDKLSPLSETTNLAPAVAGSELFAHVRHMLYTTVPAILIAFMGYGLIGLFYTPDNYDPSFVLEVTRAIEDHFRIGLHTLIAPVIVLVLIVLKTPAIPALLIGALSGAAEALLFQPQLFAPAEGEAHFRAAYAAILTTAYDGFSIQTGNALIDNLFSRGGMAGMLSTVLLIIMAMLFGGAMEATGMLRRIAVSILQLVRGAGSLVGATIGTCIVFNLTASDQYLAIVVPGRMFRDAYEKRGLDYKNLSRALEDGGTVTSVLIPWNTCGAFAGSVLTVNAAAYLPFAFFNLLCPVISIFLAAMNLTIAKTMETATTEVDAK